MSASRTRIRLIEPDDAEALAAHLRRDAEALARWDPERPPDYYTPAGQRDLRNNGFLPCGVFRSHIFTAGAWRDEILWERLLD
jgi:RimJ/RimL family protein N-acetyltransferase